MKRLLLSAVALALVAFPSSAPAMGRQFGMPMMSSHLGRSMSLGDLTFSVYPRIITPNGDGANDKAGFHFDNPQDLPVSGEVFDLSGAKVANLQPGSDPAELLLWDGKDSNGQTVPGGIYLYQIEYEGNQATGSVVVAR